MFKNTDSKNQRKSDKWVGIFVVLIMKIFDKTK